MMQKSFQKAIVILLCVPFPAWHLLFGKWHISASLIKRDNHVIERLQFAWRLEDTYNRMWKRLKRTRTCVHNKSIYLLLLLNIGKIYLAKINKIYPLLSLSYMIVYFPITDNKMWYKMTIVRYAYYHDITISGLLFSAKR